MRKSPQRTAAATRPGLRSLHDGDPDDPMFSENHASIIGIPAPPPVTDEDIKLANDYHSRPAEVSSLNYDRSGKLTDTRT